jgi:beta-galactosidase
LNDKLIGTKETSRATEFKAAWQVPYEKGILKVVGYSKGAKVAEWQLATAGEPAEIHLTADRNTIKANSQDLSYITVKVTDKNGILNPQFNNLINFSIEGEGKIAAVGNSNPTSIESFKQPYRKAYEGKCLVIIQSEYKPGKINLTATSEGLISDRITIDAR